MNFIKASLPDWIKRQASLGSNVQVDGEYSLSNRFGYMLTVCCPLQFEAYAIVLHPFWINDKIKELSEAGIEITPELRKQEDFKPLTWKHFFSIHSHSFDLSTASETVEAIREEIIVGGWPEHIWFPSEGNMDDSQLVEITKAIESHYGDQQVNFYYCLLKTHDWFGNEVIYRGSLSEVEKLWTKDNIRDNPTAIFPDSAEWSIVSDYDLPFSYIGGSKELIDKITSIDNIDIFKINPIYQEKRVQVVKEVDHSIVLKGKTYLLINQVNNLYQLP